VTLLDTAFLSPRGRGISFLQVGVGLRWLGHVLGCVGFCYLAPLFGVFRVSLRVPFEFWSLI
jgi:hypothetical protein